MSPPDSGAGSVAAPPRKDAREIVRAALEAVEPRAAVRRHLLLEGERLRAGDRTYELEDVDRILVIGAGKAGAPMAGAVEEILGGRIAGGHVVVKYGHGSPTERIVVHEAAHPVPDEAGVEAAEAILRLLEGTDERTLVVCLLSGGGSALLVRPAEGIGLDDVRVTTEALLACGASIVEVNTLRKHLSAVKGGQLARAAAPARVLTLVLSDVVGDPLDAIASGPASPDPTTFAGALEIVDRYDLRERVPGAVIERLEAGAAGEIDDTPKADDPLFDRVQNLVVGNNDQAVRAAAERARELGYRPCVLTTLLEGEAREVAIVHGAIAREALQTGRPVEPPACLISGGETTVTIRGDGKGGRNQEFALAAALEIDGIPGVLACCVGTDGSDGPTDAAGAMADGATVERARNLGLDARDHLERNDSYRFFDALDDLVRTGPTQTNVMDVNLFLLTSGDGSQESNR